MDQQQDEKPHPPILYLDFLNKTNLYIPENNLGNRRAIVHYHRGALPITLQLDLCGFFEKRQ